MLKLSDVLRGWFKGVNTLAFSACLRLERGHLGSSSFAFTLYDETHNDVQIPCVVQPSSFYILQGLNLHMHERTKVVVDVWCIVHGYFKHIEVTSLHVDVPLSITNCSQFHEVPVTKTGFIVGKSALLRRGSFSVRLVNNQGEFFVLCDNWIFCVLSYEFISPGACIKFIGLQPGRCNDVLLVTEKTSIHKVSDPCLRLLGTDRFVGVITSLGIVPLHPYTTKKLFTLDERITVYLTHFPLAHSSVSASLRKGATVAIWNFHRLFNEESGDVVTFALCSYSTFQVIEFSTSSENNEKWLNSTVNAFKLFSEYTLSDAATLCCIVCQLEEKWIFLPWQVIFEYAKKLFCSLGLNLEKCEAKPESQVEAHYRSSRCTSLGPGPPFLKRLQKVPTIREVTQRNLVLKQGLTYCMNKSEDELLVGVAHNVHKKHGVTMFRLEDGTGHIQVCTSPGEEIHNGSFVAFNGFILIKESEPRGYGEGWNENTRHMTYAVINSQREELADCDREVSIFIARKFGLHGNAVILEDDLSSKGSIVNIEFESQVTAGRYIAGVGYKIWVNRLWETTKVIREGYRSTVLHRTEKWADINPIVKDELTKGAARVGTLVYKITETASVPTVHLLCRDESETGTFAVELGWEATKKLCLLPGAVVAFRGLVFFPTRKTIFGTTGTYLYDATNSEYTLIDLPTQRDFEALRPPRPLPNFSGSQLWGLPKMTILDYNKIKPISGCVICCNIVSVKYFNVPNAIPYFRGALAAVFDDGTDVWHGRVENEALKKLLGLLKDDQGCYEWNKRLSMLIVNEKVVNVEATNPVCEAEELLKDI